MTAGRLGLPTRCRRDFLGFCVPIFSDPRSPRQNPHSFIGELFCFVFPSNIQNPILSRNRFSYRKSKFYYNKNTQLNIRHNPSKNKSILYFLICFIPFFLGFLVPFTFIFFNTLDTINLADFTKVINLTINSISVSTLSSFLVILFALFFLYVERISKTKINSYISNLISLGYALPGAVIALSLMILFSDSLVFTFINVELRSLKIFLLNF